MKKTAKITPEYLENIFESKLFKKSLKECADITYQKGLESGFRISQNFNNNKFFLDNLSEGSCDHLGGIEQFTDGKIKYSALEDRKNKEDIFNSYNIIHLHFHPHATRTIFPSEADLFVISSLLNETAEREKYEIRGLCGIASVNKRKKVKLMLIQPKIKLDSFFVEELSDKLADFYHTHNKENQIVDILRESGLNAAMISYKPAKIGYQLNNKDRIKQFAFSPRYIGKYNPVDIIGKKKKAIEEFDEVLEIDRTYW